MTKIKEHLPRADIHSRCVRYGKRTVELRLYPGYAELNGIDSLRGEVQHLLPLKKKPFFFLKQTTADEHL